MKKYKVYTIEKDIVETDDYISDNIHKLTWHREDGPAFIEYYENGTIERISYFINGKKHRLDGPAAIWYYENSNIKYETYWINDIRHTKEQYNKELLKLKIQAL